MNIQDSPFHSLKGQHARTKQNNQNLQTVISNDKSIKNDNAVYKLTELISKRTEQWIIEKPEQWLWAHRRWGK